jgi:hypothetical protein
MDKYIHRGDIAFALLLAFFLTWYNVLRAAQSTGFTALGIARLAMGFALVAVLLEVVFALVCYLRQKPLFGKSKSQYFAWRKVLPISALISGCGTVFYYIYLPSPLGLATKVTLAVGFVAGMLLTMLYFYSLVEKK